MALARVQQAEKGVIQKPMETQERKKKISSSFGAVQSPQPQHQKTSGSKYPSKFDRMLALAEKKRANAQPNTTAIDSSDTSGPDIISVCDFVDLTWLLDNDKHVDMMVVAVVIT